MIPTLNRSQAVSDSKAVVAVYETQAEAEAAVVEFQRAGFNMAKLSVVGKDYHTDRHYLLVAHGTAAEINKAKEIIEAAKPTEIHNHVLAAAKR
jgi:predicted NAD-dependent protein-ADP-ribosyltransferase YbiA (DUF1768 family)